MLNIFRVKPIFIRKEINNAEHEYMDIIIPLIDLSRPIKGATQTNWQFNLELEVATHISTMGKTEYEAFRYSNTTAVVFGIVGNILVILSIVRQKKNVLKNNYYYLVLQLAICDLVVLIIYVYEVFKLFGLDVLHSVQMPKMYVAILVLSVSALQCTGVAMMLLISLLRYRATLHPLKPAISRRNLKIVCGLMYLVGLILAIASGLPALLIKSNALSAAYKKFYFASGLFFVGFLPTIFMCVVYCKIALALIKQSKHMRSRCEPCSSFNLIRHIRNRRTLIVCLSTVLCYGIAHIPMSVWYTWIVAGESDLRMEYDWVYYLSYVLKIAGSHSVNPLVYGLMDKKLLTFWNFCRKKSRKHEIIL